MDIQNTSTKFVRSDFELIERLSDCPHDLFNEKLDWFAILQDFILYKDECGYHRDEQECAYDENEKHIILHSMMNMEKKKKEKKIDEDEKGFHYVFMYFKHR